MTGARPTGGVIIAAFIAVLPLTPAAHAVDRPGEMLHDHAQEMRAEALGRQLRCLVCQNEDIEDSRADLARDLRRAVRVQIASGHTDRQIMAWMTARYGNFIRLSPPLIGATLPLWLMPGLALGFATWFAIRGFVARRRAPPAPPAPLDEAERRRLETLTRP